MGRRPKHPEDEHTSIVTPPAYPESEEAAFYETAEAQEEETGDGEEGREGDGGSGGGLYFDEAEPEHDFDPTELQGLSLPIFRTALQKGLKLVNQITKHSDHYLRSFLPDIALRSRVVEMAFSERGFRTLLLDKGEIVQYQTSFGGKLERVRVSPDLEAERAVKYAMAGFLAAGESIDPRHVKFGRSPEFEARMKPIWTREWKRMLREEQEDLRFGPPRDAKFSQTLNPPPPRTKKARARQELPREKLRLGLPRIGSPRSSGPKL